MPTNRCHILRGALCACPRSVRACARTAGFTLIEVMIVIGIIGILAAVLLGQFGGATESARAAECLTHMRNLANSVQNFGMAKDYYPTASDVEYISMSDNSERYLVHKGYISRYSANDPYARNGGASSHQNLESPSPYNEDPEVLRYCVTNGAIWAYGAKKLNEYVCPAHLRFVKNKPSLGGPGWSYVMNPYFGYDWSDGAEATGSPLRPIRYGECKRPDKRLLFAELQWEECKDSKRGSLNPNFSKSAGTFLDGVLQYDRDDWSGTDEQIGFNHKVGKNYVAHVCFADGHTERLTMPTTGDLKELTKWLCDSDDVQFSSGRWERRHKASDED